MHKLSILIGEFNKNKKKCYKNLNAEDSFVNLIFSIEKDVTKDPQIWICLTIYPLSQKCFIDMLMIGKIFPFAEKLCILPIRD